MRDEAWKDRGQYCQAAGTDHCRPSRDDDVLPHFVGDACSPTSAKGAVIDHEPHRFLQGGKVGKQWTNVLKPS
jgi:hypothetical protein